VAFTAPGKCFGETTALSDLSYSQDASSIVQWHWNFGDSTTSNLQNPTHTYLNPGIYQISLTITTDSLCKSNVVNPTVVYTIPQPNFNPNFGCDNTPIQFSDQTTDDYPITQWYWTFGDLQSATSNESTIKNPLHQFDTAGVYQIKLVVHSFFGCADSIVKPIEIRKAPFANFEYSNTCFGQTTWFSDSSIYDSWNLILQRWWGFDDGSTSQNPVSSILFTNSGLHTVSYFIKTLNGCIDTIQKQVMVYANPIANFTTTPTCLNQPIILESSSTVANDTITSNFWSINNQIVGNSTPITLQVDSAKTYSIQLNVETAHQCKDSVVKALEVRPIPTANFTYQYDEHTIGDLVQFTNTTLGGSNFEWYNTTSMFSTEENPLFDFVSEGSYPVVLIAKNQYQCTDTANAIVLISNPRMDMAVSNLTITPNGNFQQATVQILNMSNRVVTDLWMNLRINEEQIRERWSGVLLSGESAIYSFHTQVKVPASETVSYGCVEVELPSYSQETNLDNNRDCITLTNDFKIISTYPNPAVNTLNLIISVPYTHAITISLSTASGANILKLENQEITKGVASLKIPLDAINSGVYVLEITFNDSVERKKIVILK
jgi:PKD repeat protein